MCFALNTPVESPKGPRPIEDYFVGDPVMAASAAGDGSWSWATYTVEFSSGTGPGIDQPAMIYIHFGDDGVLIVSPDQPLLIGGGMLKRADQLVTGIDSLVAAGGGAVPIEQVSVGSYTGGVHDIATGISSSLDWDGSLDGHLLNAAGVICGDFVLQIRHGDPRMARYLAVGPTIGSSEYENAQPRIRDEREIGGELER